MFLYIMYMLFLIFIMMLIFNFNKYFSFFKKMSLEKKIPFECGFNPISKFLLPFSMPFFIISLMFLIFDMEITLLIPLIMFMKFLNYSYMINLILLILYSLLITLILEWMLGYLNWLF